MTRRVGLITGDTPGHVYPALAVAEAYRRLIPHASVVFFGSADGPGAALIAQHGYPYEPASASALARVGPLGAVAAVGRTLIGIVRARRALQRHSIDLVVGFGGFASGAVVLGARSLGLPTAIHEANVVPGLANRLLAHVADRVFTSAWIASGVFPAGKIVTTGWPIRHELATPGASAGAPHSTGPVRVLVYSGSRGGAFFATAIPELMAHLAAAHGAVEVRHIAGDASADAIRASYAQRGITASVQPVLDRVADAYTWSHLVIARSGAGTLAELAAAGAPALLVPLPDAAGGHQRDNAQAYCRTGAAVCMEEAHWTLSRATEQAERLLSPDSWAAASRAALGQAVPDAASATVDACERLIEGGRS